jgi:type I restriction enzyme S subunit
MGSGSVFKNLKTDYIKELDIILPSERILQMSKIILESTFEKLKTSENENLKLTQLRDWLLPMLMNGQVTVQ